MTQNTCLTCKHRDSGSSFYDPHGCRLWGGSRYDLNRHGHCGGHAYSLWTWLIRRWVDKRGLSCEL